jgi:ATP-dependent protease ClpP protease subunit
MNIDISIFKSMSDEDFLSNKFTHIYFNDDVSNSSVNILIDEIKKANKPIVNENKAIIKPKPILIHISSYGGIISAGMRLLSIFAMSNVPIVTMIDNYSCSAATFLSIASHYRIMTKYSFCLIHEYSLVGYISDNKTQIKSKLSLYDTYFSKIIEMYMQQTNFTETELNELLQHDLYLNASYCLEKGIVDRVLNINKQIDKNKKHNIYDIMHNNDNNNIMVSSHESKQQIDKILFEEDIMPVILYPNRDDDNNINNKNKIKKTIFESINLIPRIEKLKVPTYAIIEGPISIDDLLPMLYCDNIYMFDHAYIVCNILYFHNKSALLLSDNIKNTETIFNVVRTILKEKTKMSNKMIDDINNKFNIINATDAKKLGLCNEIITYRHSH